MSKILDIQKSISAANGNISLAKELFTMLLDELDSRLLQIESSYQSNNLEALEEQAHKLFGATAYCVVPKLRSCADKLEQALKRKDYKDLEILVNEIQREIKQILSEGPAILELDWLDLK